MDLNEGSSGLNFMKIKTLISKLFLSLTRFLGYYLNFFDIVFQICKVAKA